MKTIITRGVLILVIFSLIGFIWGKLKPVRVELVYTDLKPTYRNTIIKNLEKEKLNDEIDLGFQNSTANNSSEEKIQNNPGEKPVIEKTNDSEKQEQPKKIEKPEKELNFDLESVENSKTLFSHELTDKNQVISPLNNNSEVPLAKKNKESFLDQVKRFFRNLFSGKRDKEREEIEKQVQDKPIAVKEKEVKPVLQDNKKVTPKKAKPVQSKAKETKTEKTDQESIVSANFLLDDILPSEKKR